MPTHFKITNNIILHISSQWTLYLSMLILTINYLQSYLSWRQTPKLLKSFNYTIVKIIQLLSLFSVQSTKYKKVEVHVNSKLKGENF